MENDPLNLGEYFNCYKEINGYYLDRINLIFKKCYYTCESCDIKGDIINHNCLKCNEEYSFEINKNNFKNCYKNCSYYHYFDKEGNHYCTLNLSCPNDYPILLKEKFECINTRYESTYYNNEENQQLSELIKYSKTENKMETEINKEISIITLKESINGINFDDIKEIIFSNLNITKNETFQKTEEIKYYDSILEVIETIFTSEYFNSSKIDNGEDIILEIDKMIISFTSTENQKNSTYNNMTSINLEQCESLLREYYNISNNETLYIKKIDVIQERMKIPKIVYDVYSKFNGTNLIN